VRIRIRTVAAIVAIPILAVLVFAVYGFTQHYAAVWFFPRVVPRPHFEMVTCAVLAAIAAAAVATYPLERLYRRAAFAIAVLVAAPLLYFRVSEIAHYWGTDATIVTMSSIEAATLLATLLAGVWLVRRRVGARGQVIKAK